MSTYVEGEEDRKKSLRILEKDIVMVKRNEIEEVRVKMWYRVRKGKAGSIIRNNNNKSNGLMLGLFLFWVEGFKE